MSASYIAVDLGGTIIKVGLVRGGKVIATRRLEAVSAQGLQARLPALEEAVGALAADDLAGVALAFPGIVDFPARRALSTNAKYDDAPSIDLEQWVRERWGVPFVMDNDARMALVGEWKRGAGRGTENMVMMTIGTGIGTGVVVDGKPLYGRSGCAGSLGGHMIVDYKGRRCTCGNVGCVEAHGASFFLKEIIQDLPGVSDRFKADKDNWNFKSITDKVRLGDADAAAVLQECIAVWSAGIVNYIHAYDPEKVVIGGGIMKSADLILPAIRSRVESLAWTPAGKVEIVASQLGDEAALLAADYYFEKHE